MIRKIGINIVIALLILLNGPTQAIAFSIASDAGCGKLVVSSIPNEDQINPLKIQDSSTTAEIPIFLRQQNRSEQDLEDVHLTAYLFDQKDNTQQADVSSSFKSRDDDVGPDGITLPKSGSPVPIAMILDNLPESGDFTIRLYADCGKGTELLLEAPLTRQTAAKLSIEDSKDGVIDPIKRTGKDFAYTIRIVPENQAKIEDLYIDFENFMDTIGDQIEPTLTIDGKEITVPHGPLSVPWPGGIVLNVEAELPHEGTYKSRIILNYDGNQESTELTVDRQPSTTVVTAEVPDKSSVIPRWPFNADDSETNDPLEIVLQSTSTRPATIDSKNVRLLHLYQLKDGGRKDGVTADLKPMNSNQPGQNHLVSSGNSLKLRYEITGLKGAGTYEGELEVGVANAQPLNAVPFTLKLKEPKWLAALVIIVGILASTAFRWINGTGISSLKRQKLALEYLVRLDKIRDEYDEKIPSDSKPTLDGFFNSIRKDLVDIAAGNSNQDAESKLDTAGKKLALVPEIVSTIIVIEKIPVKERSTFRSRWEEYIQRIILNQTISDEDIKALKDLNKEVWEETRARRLTLDQELENKASTDQDELDDLTKRARGISRKILFFEIVLFLITLFLATWMGLYSLWEPNDTWGSGLDILAAVLWGFGLYQASNAVGTTFVGLPDLRKKIQNLTP